MKKIAILAATAALFATGSVAMAEENLETTGNRAAISTYSDVYLAQRDPAHIQATRRYYNAAPVATQSRSAEENWFHQADRLSNY